jgi:oligosaccharide repeat unit polymerase
MLLPDLHRAHTVVSTMIENIIADVWSLEPAWWLAWIPAFAIGYIALLSRLTQGSWLAPGAAWAVFWTFATWGPLLLAPNYPVSPSALWVIASFVFVVWVFSTIPLRGLRYEIRLASPHHCSPPMRWLSYLGLGAGITMTALTLSQYGATWRVWLSARQLSEVANAISTARYAGEADESVAVRICMVFCYLGSLAGGHALAWRPRRRWIWWPFASIFGALFYALLTTAKAGVLYSTIFWLAAFLAESTRRRGRPWRIGPKAVLIGAMIGALVVTLFVSAMLLRYGSDSAGENGFLVERLRNYFCAHLSAFSSWWDSDSRLAEPLGWGRISFFGPAALLGQSPRQQGVYEVIFTQRYTVDSNIFTIYRGLIADFSLPGALVFVALSSLVAGLAYRRLFRASGAMPASLVLTAFFAVMAPSFVINLFGYSTLLLAFLLYGSVCLAPAAFRRRLASAAAINLIHAPTA